jgi:hypothetical protein
MRQYMSTKETENHEQELNNRLGSFDMMPPPPPEPIYDLTTSDKTELVKAAGPIERGENP